MALHRLCVYCSSRRGLNETHQQHAIALGQLLAEHDITLVYGGAHVGMMGILADAVLTAGGQVIGVIPETLRDKEVAHAGLTELHVVADMHERKAKMASLADGFVAMPGGLGTLEELFEMLTWQQIGLHDKPVGLLNSDGYYDQLLAFLDRIVAENYFSDHEHSRLVVASTPAELMVQLGNW